MGYGTAIRRGNDEKGEKTMSFQLTEEQLLEKLNRRERLSFSEKKQFDMIMKQKFVPEEDMDFFIKKIKEYMVSLDVTVRMETNGEDPDETTIVLKAIEGIRNRQADADGDVVHTDTIKTFKIDAQGAPFDEAAWRSAKVKELLPKRPWEVMRPPCETTLLVF